MEYRRLNSNDAHLIKKMALGYKSKVIDESDVNNFINNPDNYLIGCIDSNMVVGFLLAYRLQRYDGKNDMIYIHEIEVMENYQRKGIGRTLIELMHMLCIEMKTYKMFVITNKSNKAAIELYKSSGAISENDDDIVFVYSD